jgi:hypothetical protein
MKEAKKEVQISFVGMTKADLTTEDYRELLEIIREHCKKKEYPISSSRNKFEIFRKLPSGMEIVIEPFKEVMLVRPAKLPYEIILASL